MLNRGVNKRAPKRTKRLGKGLVQKLLIMYYTGESLLDGNFPSEAWTGQRGLHTDWDNLFQELITVILYEKKQQLGMLNPYAAVYTPKWAKTREWDNDQTKPQQSKYEYNMGR